MDTKQRSKKIISSITEVSALAGGLTRAQAEVTSVRVMEGLCEFSKLLLQKYFKRRPKTVGKYEHSVLEAIGRGHDENTHSDFIASLLRSSTAPNLASKLFLRLWRTAGN